MRLELHQVSKTTLTADFQVLRAGQVIGNARYQSYLESGQGVFEGRLGGDSFSLSYGKSRLVAIGIDNDRPYSLSVNGVDCGEITSERRSNAYGSGYISARLTSGELVLDLFPFSCGRAGFRYPVFAGAAQVAEFRKGCKVVDDLNDFEIAIADESLALPVVILCCYIFAVSWWRPGPARRKSKNYYIQKKTRPETDGYDEGFFDRVAL